MLERPTNIAVLDDDQSVRNALARLLRASELRVDTYATSLDFFRSIEKRSPDCLILDLQMPGINGFDVMHYLSERGFHIPIVVITAHDAPGSRESCLGAGANAYLRKPFDADELIGIIGKMVDPNAK